MAYDPYSQMPSDEGTIGGFASEALNPVNWFLWKYQYDPRAWSFRKGIHVPFGKNLSPKQLLKSPGNLRDTYQYGKKMGYGFFKTTGRMLDDVVGGEFYLGERFFKDTGRQIAANRALRKNLTQQVSQGLTKTNLNKSQVSRISKQVAIQLEDVLDQAGDLSKLNQKVIKDRLVGMGKSAFVKDLGLDANKWNQLIRKTGVPSRAAIGTAVEKAGATEFLGALSMTGAKRMGRIAAKTGILAMKGIAFWSLATTMYDITKMIGEPIGRYLVENTNRVAAAYQNRFAPEMGGKIAMSYMSTGAATERQRAIEAISRSYINGRSAIGREAEYMHGF